MEKLKRIKKQLLSDLKLLRLPIIVLAVYMVPTQLIFHTTCPFAIMTGLPCPGCGLTRAAFLILQFRFADAARMNFTIYLWAAVAVYFIVDRYILEKKKFNSFVFVPVGAVMIALWAYRMLYVFPGPEPMEYREFNIFKITIDFLAKHV